MAEVRNMANQNQTTNVSDRHWQALCEGAWTDVVGIDRYQILLATGDTIRWRVSDMQLEASLQVRYTVAVRGDWMPYRYGNFPLMAEDFGRPDVAMWIRRLQVEARRERMVQHGYVD